MKRKFFKKAVVGVMFCSLIATSIYTDGLRSIAESSANDQVKLWTTYDTYPVLQDEKDMHVAKVMPPKVLSEGDNLQLNVNMGLGETEAAQLIMTPTKAVKSFNLTVSDLKNGEHTIPETAISVFKQCYVNVYPERTDSNYQSALIGWYPDFLLPLDVAIAYKENNIQAGKNQGITIDVSTTSETVPGVYTGVFVLDIDGQKRNVPISVTVHDVDLTQTHMGSTAASSLVLPEKTYEMLMNDYRVMCQYTPRGTYSPETMAESLEKYWDNPKFVNYEIPNGSVAEFEAYLWYLARVSTLERNYLSKAICYMQALDEINDGKKAIEGVRPFREAKQRVINQLGSMHTDQVLIENIKQAICDLTLYIPINNWDRRPKAQDFDPKNSDITFCLSSGVYLTGEEMFEEYTSQSKNSAWIYPNSGYPNLGTAMPCLGQGMRLLGMTCAQGDIEGVLFWDIDANKTEVTSNRGSIEVYKSRDYYTDSNGWSTSFGNGYLIFPSRKYGDHSGAYPSMRLKSFRDGVEDFELIYQLNELLQDGVYENYGLPADMNTDSLLKWVYDKVLSTKARYYPDDGTALYQVREILFSLYELANSPVKFVNAGVTFKGEKATISFYTEADGVKINGEGLVGVEGKYTYTWDMNVLSENISIEMTKDSEVYTFQANVFGYGTVKNAISTSSISAENIASFVESSPEGGKGYIPAGTFGYENNTINIGIPTSKGGTGLQVVGYAPEFALSSKLFSVDNLFDIYCVEMTIKVKTREEINGTLPLTISLTTDKTNLMLTSVVFDEKDINADGWYERHIRFNIDRLNMKNATKLSFIFQSYHTEYFNMGADIQISDVYYTMSKV